MNYEKAVEVFGKIVAAYIEVVGMQAENIQRQEEGLSISYGEGHFLSITNRIERIVTDWKSG